jgi:hypothetical protein
MMENAVRVSAFRVGLANGMSTEQAASLAKNLTVNFNRKGAKTGAIASFYAFFNAAIQGIGRMGETLVGPSGRAIMASGVMLGMINAIMGALLLGDDDDEPGEAWGAIPEFVRERNFIIGYGSTYVTVPQPLGYNFFTNLGRIAAEYAMGINGKTPGQAAVDVMMAAGDAFNPLGMANFMQMLTPTVFDPAVALATNRDWTNRPIYREDFSGMSPTPGLSRAKDTASPWASR